MPTKQGHNVWPVRHDGNAQKKDMGGEGSRGGQVIGHTGSGKPIYENAKHPSHGGFNALEHFEAAALHEKDEKEHKRGFVQLPSYLKASRQRRLKNLLCRNNYILSLENHHSLIHTM